MRSDRLFSSSCRAMAIAFLWIAMLIGCQAASRVLPNATWHQKCGWKGEDYFDDPKVVALCRAIETNDIVEIDRLVASGVNVNAQGKRKMTPLLWAFPDNKLERFKRILEHGADPNVAIESDFNTHGGMSAGDSVTHMACKTAFPGYFEVVFEHGGDPNLIKNGIVSNQAPLHSLISGRAPRKKAKVKALIENGADLNHMDGGWTTPTMRAIGWGGQYDIALVLLEAGADHTIYKPKSNSRLIHIVLAEERRNAMWTPQQRNDYRELLRWLEAHGESIEKAKEDRERWKSWNQASGEYRRKMDAEIAERKRRERREKASAQEVDKDAK